MLAESYRAENYAPDLILAEAIKFIGAHKAKPFFLYLPFVEPHLAMQPHQEDIDKYPKSWDTEPYRGKHGYLPHPRPRAGYAAMITDLDNHVGTIIAKLKSEGVYDNTLIIFTSDNGATANSLGGVDTKFFNSVNGLRGSKGSVYEGGLRVPTIEFSGTAIGAYLLAGKDAGIIKCTVDGQQTKEIDTLYPYSSFNYPMTVMFFNELDEGKHTIKLEILENRKGRLKPGGTALRVIGFTAN